MVQSQVCACHKMRPYKRAKFNGFFQISGLVVSVVAAGLFAATLWSITLIRQDSVPDVGHEVALDFAPLFNATGDLLIFALFAGLAFILLFLSVRQVWRCRSCGYETTRSGWRSRMRPIRGHVRPADSTPSWVKSEHLSCRLTTRSQAHRTATFTLAPQTESHSSRSRSRRRYHQL